jgi:hypothetical protein
MRTFVRKGPIPSQLKQIKGNLHVYLALVPLFNILTKLAISSSYSEMSLLLLCSFSFSFPFLFDLLDSLCNTPMVGTRIFSLLRRNKTRIRGLYSIFIFQSFPSTISMLRNELRVGRYPLPRSLGSFIPL